MVWRLCSDQGRQIPPSNFVYSFRYTCQNVPVSMMALAVVISFRAIEMMMCLCRPPGSVSHFATDFKTAMWEVAANAALQQYLLRRPSSGRNLHLASPPLSFVRVQAVRQAA